MTNTLADAITAHLEQMGDDARNQHEENEVEEYRSWLDAGWDLVRLALDLELNPDLPCYIARADGSKPCGPFDTVSEANAWIGYDERYGVGETTIADAARLFPFRMSNAWDASTPLVALLTLPAHLQSLVGA